MVASGGPSVGSRLAGEGGSNPWGPRERRLGLQRRPEQEAGGPRRVNPAVLPVVASVPSLSPWS